MPETSTNSNKGPTGFLTDGQDTLVVQDGLVFKDIALIGTLFEDGYLQSTESSLDNSAALTTIDAISPWKFRGIDSQGLELILPEEKGPTGNLIYNGQNFAVINGRIITEKHEYLGYIKDSGEIYLRNRNAPNGRLVLHENILLNFSFAGKNSEGNNWQHQFNRPLYRSSSSYTDNEIIRYFDGFDKLNAQQKKYLLETMTFWSKSGILQVVRKSEGDASLGNVKHGATGVTRIRTGNVTLDKEEFEREVDFYKKYGPIMNVSKNSKGYLEVRLNLVVSHEFGHQVDFVLTPTVQDQVLELYDKRKKVCDRLHPVADNQSEYLMPQQLEQRHFISGYAKASVHEYWAECLAAFSLKETRAYLKEIDRPIYDIMVKLVKSPAEIFGRVFHDTMTGLQASLRFGKELTDEFFNEL